MFYRIAISCLGAVVLVCAISAALLAHSEKEIPGILNTFGSTAIGALAGLFAASR